MQVHVMRPEPGGPGWLCRPTHPRCRLWQWRHGVHERQWRQPRQKSLAMSQHAQAAHIWKHGHRWAAWKRQREAARKAELVGIYYSFSVPHPLIAGTVQMQPQSHYIRVAQVPGCCRYAEKHGPPYEARPRQEVGPRLPPGGWRAASHFSGKRASSMHGARLDDTPALRRARMLH